MDLLYLNNAATSYPKPRSVIEAVQRALSEPPAEPGRGSSVDDPLRACRGLLARLLGVDDPCRVILTPSATHSLNLVIQGVLIEPGAHVVTTELEHNSVLRPLHHLEQAGRVSVSYLPPAPTGAVDPGHVAEALRPETRLIVLTHASNVTGAVQPIELVAAQAAKAGVPLLIDAAQSAGCVPLSHRALPGRVYIAFAGHKGLLGPAGTGGLIVPDADLPPLLMGGTGIRSEARLQPEELPLRHEAGTPNLCGVAGLAAGARHVLEQGVAALGRRRAALVTALREELARQPGITLSPLAGDDGRAGVVSLNLKGREPGELGYLLREGFGIEVRTGLHCAPLVHRRLGSAPAGTLRVSVGEATPEEAPARLAAALRQIGADGCG